MGRGDLADRDRGVAAVGAGDRKRFMSEQSKIENRQSPIRPVPPWGTVETAAECLGITRRWLEELVEAGEVRKKKHGEARQARAVYCLADVVEFFEKPANA